MSLIGAGESREAERGESAPSWSGPLLFDDGRRRRSRGSGSGGRWVVTVARVVAIVSSVLAGVCLLTMAKSLLANTEGTPVRGPSALVGFACYSWLASAVLFQLLKGRRRK